MADVFDRPQGPLRRRKRSVPNDEGFRTFMLRGWSINPLKAVRDDPSMLLLAKRRHQRRRRPEEVLRQPNIVASPEWRRANWAENAANSDTWTEV